MRDWTFSSKPKKLRRKNKRKKVVKKRRKKIKKLICSVLKPKKGPISQDGINKSSSSQDLSIITMFLVATSFALGLTLFGKRFKSFLISLLRLTV